MDNLISQGLAISTIVVIPWLWHSYLRPIKKSSWTELSVLQLIYALQSVSRGELAERSGLGSSTITRVIASLMERGFHY
jgi:DNA-binding MarR family transcriptional regulator